MPSDAPAAPDGETEENAEKETGTPAPSGNPADPAGETKKDAPEESGTPAPSCEPGNSDGNAEEEAAAENEEDGIALLSDTNPEAVARVTMTTADGAVWSGEYTDLPEAFKAARLSRFTDEDGGVRDADTTAVELLKPGQTYLLESDSNYPIRFEYSVNVTVDLNGCTLKRTAGASNHGILSVTKGNVTFRNGALEFTVPDTVYNYPRAIKLSDTGAVLTLTNVTVNVAAGKDGNGNTKGYAIHAASGTLNIAGGVYGRIWVQSAANAKLSGGSYESVEYDGNYADLLPQGYIFAMQQDSAYIDPAAMKYNDVTFNWDSCFGIKVIPCTHGGGYTEGICDRCGYECPHEEVVNNSCTVCGAQMVAQDDAGMTSINTVVSPSIAIISTSQPSRL